MGRRLFLKPDRSYFPQVKDRYPLLYLERGRLEVDDSSVKYICCDRTVVMIPVAEIQCILLGPGTSITHEAVKAVCSCGCSLCFVGEDCLHFYCHGISPTSDTRNLMRQLSLAYNHELSLKIARELFAFRFQDIHLELCSLQEMMGIEGNRVKNLYREKALKYNCKWQGRSYIPGQQDKSDLVNKRLTFYNALLYGLCTSTIVSLGFSPYFGFIHKGSPLPMTYDFADLYKSEVTIDLAFSRNYIKNFERTSEVDAFVEKCCEISLLKRMSSDLVNIFDEELSNASPYR